MLPTESLLEVVMWLKRVDISCAVLTSQLFRNIAATNSSLLALHPVESLTLINEGDDSTTWKLSAWYAEQVNDASDEVETEEEESEQTDHFELDADFDECFRRFTLVLQICSVERCEINARIWREAALSPAQWNSFVDATKLSIVADLNLIRISLRELNSDEFFELTRIPGLRELTIKDCTLLSAFVDARFVRACGESGITALDVAPGPVDGTHCATDDQSLLDFCFKLRAGTSSPTELSVLLYRPTISADFVASFTQAYPSNAFRGRVGLHFGHYPPRRSCGRRQPEWRVVPELHVNVAEDLISFEGR